MKIQRIKKLRLSIFILIYLYALINSFPLLIMTEAYSSQFVLGSTLLIYGGWFGLLLISFSNKFVKNLNILSAFKFGILGCSLLIVNIFFLVIVYPPDIHVIDICPECDSYYSFVFWYNILGIILFCFSYGILLLFQFILKEDDDESIIRKTILDFGTKLTRLKIDEIAEKTETFHKTIIKVVGEMIDNGKIYARYFKSSNSVVFNQERNVKNIDELLAMYKEWEEVKGDKN